MNQLFKGHLEDIILDEIALEGLEGITLEGLWVRLSVTLQISLPLPICMRRKIWSFILKLPEHLQFFIIPKSRPCLKVMQRNDLVFENSNDKRTEEDCPSRTYKYNPIDEGKIMGSCQYYKERVKIENEEIKDVTLEDANKRWGNTFVIVAVQHLREQTLILDSHNPTLPRELKMQAYCVLERIGRSRHYGEATIGKHSLLNMHSDSTILFYLRSRLIRLNLIKKQPYQEKSQAGSLLQLQRFVSLHEAYQLIILAESLNYLKSRGGLAQHSDLREHVHQQHGVVLKKLLRVPLFRKYISPATVSYREVYPDATVSQYSMKNNKNKEKTLKVLKLNDMNMKIDEIFEEEEAEDEETAKVFLSKDNLYMDVPFDEQVYEHIKAQGAQGIAQSHLAKHLGIRKLCIRRIIKKLLFQGRIGYYLKDEGRQRMNIYVVRKYLPAVEEKTNSKFTTPKKLTEEHHEMKAGPSRPIEESSSQEANVQLNSHTRVEVTAPTVMNNTSIDSLVYETLQEVREELPTSIEIFDENETDFKMIVKESGLHLETTKRKRDLLTKRQILRRDTVIELSRQKHILDTTELVRYIISSEQAMGFRDTLCRKSLARLLAPMHREKNIRMYDVRMEWRKYVKHVKLVCESSVHIKHDLLQQELGKIKESFFSSISLKRRKNQNDLSIPISRRSKFRKVQKQGYQKQHSERVGSAKFIRAKLVHETLFHLLYVLKEDQKTIPFDEIASTWKEFDLSIDTNEMKNELPPVYVNDVNWTMFLSPLPKYNEYPPGWVCLKDFLMQIPLSIYVKLHRVKEHTNTVIQEYLKHPIRRHYTIRGLPLHVRDYIHLDSRYVSTVEDILRLLGQMGLIQFGPRLNKETIQNFIYLNRNAVIMDTTLSEPGYARISADRDYPLLQFAFTTYNDVTEFWMTLQNVCMATKLGYIGKRDRSQELRRPVMKQLPEVAIDDAPKKDVGYLVGNRLGAAGLDWKLFAHKSRNWDLSYSAEPKRSEVTKIPPKLRYTAFKIPQRGIRQIFFKRVKKQVVAKKANKLIYDDVDKECIQRMDQLRVRWDEKEDRLLMICRVANTFLQGNTGSKAMTAFIFRDIMQWQLQSMQKSSRSCQRRILYLMRNKAHVNQINSWLNELYQNEFINRTYGRNFFVELRKLFPSIDSFNNAARIYFVQLVSCVNQLLNKATIQHSDTIPDTLQQFGKLYRKSLDNSTVLRHFDPKSIQEVEESTINLLIHSSVCSQRDKMLYNVQLFEIYRTYDEGMIERCFRKVRVVDQLVVAGKMMSKQKFPLLGKKVCISNIYRQQFYLLIPYLIYEQSFNSFGVLLESYFRSENKAPIKYVCVNSGTSILLMELSFLSGCQVDIQIPKQVLKFDPAQVQNAAHTPDKVIDHFRRIVDEKCPNAEYTKEIPPEKTSAVTKKTQFNINVSVHKIVYNPYDTISRLSDAQIHFFCALQNLNTTVSIDDLAQKPFNCPFRCVLQDLDYLETISILINQHESFINQLAASTKGSDSIESENWESMKTTVFLDQTNITQVASYIRDKIVELFEENQKKEIGNARILQRPVNIVQLAYDSLKSDDFDGYVSDEEELLTERGENNQRYQDFLVVNAPTVSISFQEDKCELVPYKDLKIPEYLLSGLEKKQQILDKVVDDALWKYVDNSFEDLEKEMDIDGFTDDEKILTRDVLNLIETYEFGISALELTDKYSDEKSLIKSLTILRKLYLIKRVGVERYMYVHKMKVRPWIIHSFHVKRLEREAMTPQGEINFESMKRKHDPDISEEPKNKKLKQQPEVASNSRGKRTLKSVSRYGSEPTPKNLCIPTEKVNVHLRPSPWIRVNGTLNRRVFDKWMGTVLLECTIRCTILVKNLFIRFHQLHPVNVLHLLDCLKDLGCIELKKCVGGSVNLFTEDDQIEVSEGSELTKAENMFVITLPHALQKMALFIGEKKYQIDF